MGCTFNFIELNAQNRDAAMIEATAVIEQACYEDGHGGYGAARRDRADQPAFDPRVLPAS